MSLVKRSQKWGIVIEVALVVTAWAIGAAFGVFAFHTPAARHVVVARPKIGAKATLSQVAANFAGAPYVTAALSELPGFTCQGWSDHKSWVVIRCVK